MKFISDPRIFNYLILALYFGAAIRWAIARSWADVAYWMGAILLTIPLTWGYKH